MISRYDCPQIRLIWEEPNKYLLWTKIELTFLKYFRERKVEIPTVFRQEWIQEILKLEEITKHDLGAFVQWLEGFLKSSIGEESRFVHFGLTSSDVVDTAFSLQIKATNKIINGLIDELISALDDLINKYKNVSILGRTHGQVSEKIPLINKFVSYKSMLNHFRVNERYFGKLSGSIGDYKYFDQRIAFAALGELGLEADVVNDGQIIHRAVYASYLNNWAILASIIAKIAVDIRLLSQSEIGEIREGFGKNQIASSSMPQKRNPIYSENLCGLARVIRGYQTTVMQDIELWNERDISHSSAERIIFPDAATILGFMLIRLKDIFVNLEINEQSMKHNIELFETAIEGQQKMLSLIEGGFSRSEAHKKIKEEILRT